MGMRNVARCALLMLLTVLVTAGCADATGTPGGTPSADPSGSGQRRLLVTYQRTGGIAGFDDRLSVWTDGSYTLTSRHASGSAGTLSPAELAELRRALESVSFASISPNSSPPIVDGFQHRIEYGSYTVLVADGNIPTALEPVIAALAAILRQHGSG
jgi:hypothetical protein